MSTPFQFFHFAEANKSGRLFGRSVDWRHTSRKQPDRQRWRWKREREREWILFLDGDEEAIGFCRFRFCFRILRLDWIWLASFLFFSSSCSFYFSLGIVYLSIICSCLRRHGQRTTNNGELRAEKRRGENNKLKLDTRYVLLSVFITLFLFFSHCKYM